MNQFSMEEFYYPFSWKKPLIYITILISIGLYYLLFYVYKELEIVGEIHPTKGFKIAIISFFGIMLFHIFRSNRFVKNVNSIVCRGLILAGACLLVVLCITPIISTYYKYDSHKMDSYMHILPFKNSPCLTKRPTLQFDTIGSLKRISVVDNPYVRFYLNNGSEYNFGFNNTSSRSKYLFLINLYQECEWLQADIEQEYWSIEELKKKVNEDKNYFDINAFLFYTFFIWVFVVLCICLLFYAFKIKLKNE